MSNEEIRRVDIAQLDRLFVGSMRGISTGDASLTTLVEYAEWFDCVLRTEIRSLLHHRWEMIARRKRESTPGSLIG